MQSLAYIWHMSLLFSWKWRWFSRRLKGSSSICFLPDASKHYAWSSSWQPWIWLTSVCLLNPVAPILLLSMVLNLTLNWCFWVNSSSNYWVTPPLPHSLHLLILPLAVAEVMAFPSQSDEPSEKSSAADMLCWNHSLIKRAVHEDITFQGH